MLRLERSEGKKSGWTDGLYGRIRRERCGRKGNERERDITAGKGGRRSRAPADEDDGSVGGKMRVVGRG